MKKNILIILMFVLVLGVGIVIGTNLPKQDLSNNEENNQEEEKNIKYTKEELETIITEQLHSLVNKNSLQELTNQERLRILLNLYLKNNNLSEEPIKVEDFKKLHETSVIKDLDVTYVDIYDTYTSFSEDEKGNRDSYLIYNEENNTYEVNPHVGHGAPITAAIVYKELISFEENNNEYTIKYKYVFGNTSGDGPMPYTLYYRGIDAVNKTNPFKEFDYSDCTGEYCSDYRSPALNYITSNYDNIKNHLSTYTYTFKVEDNNLVITSFNVE